MTETALARRWETGLAEYLSLYDRGLKKQANGAINTLAAELAGQPEDVREPVLFRFCRELLDEGGHRALRDRGNGALPHGLHGLVWRYLLGGAEAGRMPHLRWVYQISGPDGRAYNPFDPQRAVDVYEMLRRAYGHPERDELAVELWFSHQLHGLAWGAHHFPDPPIITPETFADLTACAGEVLAHHPVPERLVERYRELLDGYARFPGYLQP